MIATLTIVVCDGVIFVIFEQFTSPVRDLSCLASGWVTQREQSGRYCVVTQYVISIILYTTQLYVVALYTCV